MLVLFITATFSSKKPKWSLVEVEDKEGDQEDGGLAGEDQAEDQDEVVEGGQQDDRDYRLVVDHSFIFYLIAHFTDAFLKIPIPIPKVFWKLKKLQV